MTNKTPVPYSTEIADRICELIAGGLSLAQICGTYNDKGERLPGMPGMPNRTTVFDWLADERNFTFVEKYKLAREQQGDKIAEEIVHIADTERDARKARNRIHARQWLAARLRPKVYGDRIDVNGNVVHEVPQITEIAEALKRLDKEI